MFLNGLVLLKTSCCSLALALKPTLTGMVVFRFFVQKASEANQKSDVLGLHSHLTFGKN